MATSSRERPISLLGRLLIAAAVWCSCAVTLAAIVLVGLFSRHLEREADAELRDHVVELVSLARVERDGALRLAGRLPGARYQRPFSGWGWQIRRGSQVLAQSPSLGPLAPQTPLLAAPLGEVGLFEGSGGRVLRGLSRSVAPPLSAERLTFSVVRPQDDIDLAVGQYRQSVIIALGVLGVGLVATVLAAFWIGLRPLRALSLQIAEMRAGADPVARAWPREIAPIADELEALRQHTEKTVLRARSLAADLAHAVKTPLSVIRQQVGALTPDQGHAIRRQTDRIAMSLERHLGRRGAGSVPYARIAVRPCVEDLVFALSHTGTEKPIAVEVDVPEDAVFLGDEADLYEIIGNPLNNAGTWAKTQVRIGARVAEQRLELLIEDDGPGIPEVERSAILERGTRLDEATPGDGLGLAILHDLADFYGGHVVLTESAVGGLAVKISLPGDTGAA
ncbi:MAG: sensor histidine kinase [Pseudomonadota bacterium]